MAQISLQLHAEYRELIHELLPAWLSDVKCHVAVISRTGSSMGAIQLGGIELISEQLTRDPTEDLPSILIHTARFESVGDGSAVEFMRANPGFLAVQLGRRSPIGLRETVLGAVAADPNELATWRRVLGRARRSLRSGAVQVGPTGIRRADPGHRYSEGALELARTGVAMLAAAGGGRFEFDPVT